MSIDRIIIKCDKNLNREVLRAQQDRTRNLTTINCFWLTLFLQFRFHCQNNSIELIQANKIFLTSLNIIIELMNKSDQYIILKMLTMYRITHDVQLRRYLQLGNCRRSSNP